MCARSHVCMHALNTPLGGSVLHAHTHPNLHSWVQALLLLLETAAAVIAAAAVAAAVTAAQLTVRP